jgi:tetratricopeptide (TPR) repeat protein
MESDILNTLETLRGYSFALLCIISLYIFIKILQIILPYVLSYSDKLDDFIINTNYKLLKEGKINKVITGCTDALAEQPNNEYYTWQLALAYHYNNEHDLSIKYFKKAIFLKPEWKDDANEYIDFIKNANKALNTDLAKSAAPVS